MKTLNVNITGSLFETKKYKLFIGSRLLEQVYDFFDLDRYSQMAVITDRNVASHWLEQLKKSLPDKMHPIILPAGEKTKNLETIKTIWSELREAAFDRKALVINLGGGVVCDMGGFAAATYMRGLDFLHIPTTLLAQIDAGIGGKVGINYQEIKNLIGSFSQPIGVVIDIATLSTLPEREFRAGFAELIKHALIRDRQLVERLHVETDDAGAEKHLEEVIIRSCEIKAAVVEQDEKESGLRKILNFGHTIGHALESIYLGTKNELLHGEAVALGMVAEAKISQLKGFIPSEDVELIEGLIKKFGLPTRTPDKLSLQNITDRILLDKKNYDRTVQWTLLTEIGKAVFDQQVDDQHVQKGIVHILNE